MYYLIVSELKVRSFDKWQDVQHTKSLQIDACTCTIGLSFDTKQRGFFFEGYTRE